LFHRGGSKSRKTDHITDRINIWNIRPIIFIDKDQAATSAEIRRYWPGLPEAALHPDTTGIRPKLYRAGEPVADFAIHGPETHGVADLVALYGIESPGLTASLAVGEMVAGMVG
jgi:L-2-hydroxyglutarate oxidase LhgO